MKKILSVLLLSVLAVLSAAGLFACSSPSGNGGGTSGSTLRFVKTEFEGMGFYSVAGINGNREAAQSIEIPSKYDGLPVFVISAHAFNGSGITSVTIPNSVGFIEHDAFSYCRGLTSVVIPDSVTQIGEYAFAHCTSLSEVTIGRTVSEIGDYAFLGCDSLATVNYGGEYDRLLSIAGYMAFDGGNIRFICSDYDTAHPDPISYYVGEDHCEVTGIKVDKSLVSGKITIPETYKGKPVTKIGSGAFSGCVNMTEIELPEGLLQIGSGAFVECTSLTKLNIPASVTYIDGAIIRGCTSLTELTLPLLQNSDRIGRLYAYETWQDCEFDSLKKITFLKSEVTVIPEIAFKGCVAVTEINLPDNITELGLRAFGGCAALESIDLPATLTEVGDYCFAGCSSLETVDIPDGVKKLSFHMFSGCSSLKSVDMPAELEEIGEYAFYYCAALEKIDVPATVTEIGGGLFYGCESLEYVNITDIAAWCGIDFWGAVFNKRIGDTGYPIELYLNGEKVENLVIPATVKEINNSAFAGAKISSLTISEGVEEIGYNSFAGLSITEVTIPASVKEIGREAFAGSGITAVAFADGSSLEEVGTEPFAYCKITKVDIGSVGNWINHIKVRMDSFGDKYYYDESWNRIAIEKDVYIDGTKVTEITVPEGTTEFTNYFIGSTVTKYVMPASLIKIADQAFMYDKKLEEIVFPANCNLKTIGEDAFNDCQALETIDFTNATKLETIGKQAFYYSTSLNSVIFPENCTLKNIGDNAFQGCVLETFNFRNLTALENIGESVFYWGGEYCNKLSEVYIAPSVKTIGRCAFDDCGMTKLIIEGNNKNLTSIGAHAFSSGSSLKEVGIYSDLDDSIFGDGRTMSEVFSYCYDIETIKFGYVYNVDALNLFSYSHSAKEIWVASARVIAECGLGSFQKEDIEEKVDFYIEGVKFEGGAIDIPAGTTKIAPRAFQYFDSITTVRVPASVTEIGTDAFYKSGITKLIIANNSNLTEIKDSAFYECESLVSVTFGTGSSLTKIGKDAFRRFDPDYDTMVGLTSITFPASLKEIGESAFNNQKKLTSVNFEEDSELIVIYPYAFAGLLELETLTLPDSLGGIGEKAFGGCYKLVNVTIPFVGSYYDFSIGNRILEVNTYSPMSYVFPDSTNSLKSVTVTGGDVSDDIGSIYANAFSGYSNIVTLSIERGVKYISKGALRGLSNLKTLRIPFVGGRYDTLNNEVRESNVFGYIFGESSFDGTVATTQAYNPWDSVSKTYYIPGSLETVVVYGGNICISAFYGCENIKYIELRSQIGDISEYAFYGTTNLEKITYYGTEEQWNAVYKAPSWKEGLALTEIYCYNDPISIAD